MLCKRGQIGVYERVILPPLNRMSLALSWIDVTCALPRFSPREETIVRQGTLPCTPGRRIFDLGPHTTAVRGLHCFSHSAAQHHTVSAYRFSRFRSPTVCMALLVHFVDKIDQLWVIVIQFALHWFNSVHKWTFASIHGPLFYETCHVR